MLRYALRMRENWSAQPEVSATPTEFEHVYIVMARRANFAWKVTLSFESACLPGVPESVVASNDHVRAGATFGSLRFL